MRKVIIIFYALLLAFYGCKAHSPFVSRKDKVEKIQIIRNYVDFSNDEFKLIKNKDSVLFDTYMSVKNNINAKLIKRRLDSFFSKNYTEKELISILFIDRQFPGLENPIEIDRAGDHSYYFTSIDSLKLFLKKMDSISEVNSRISKKDTINWKPTKSN